MEMVKDDPFSQENLARIKKNISSSHTYQKDNVKRFRDFRKYVYESSINAQQKTLLGQLKKPVVEANLLPAYLARLSAEFAQHEPSISVTPSYGVPVDQKVLDIVEGHIRHNIYEANKNSFSDKIIQDQLSGGFSVAKVYTDYSTPMSFDQVIKWERPFDPTMCGFDPMARHSHKADGNYCFEIHPYDEEEFKRKWPDANINQVSYTRDIEGFYWTFQDGNNHKIILVANYFEKKKKRTRIVKLTDGREMTNSQYKKYKKWWNENQFIEQIPEIIKSRWTELQTICKYVVMENNILEYEETDYSWLPYVFFEGVSIELTKATSNDTYQMTIPYVYHARGIQDVKNFALQTLANYLENQIQHKFIVMKEALPQEQDFIETLNNIQYASTVVVNAFSENNPDKPIPNPIREVVNVPAPPEVMQTFSIADSTTQSILGSFASNLGKNDNDLSGKAVIESASVGNAAAMPYMMGYLAGLKQCANINVDLMPKYQKGPREIPVVALDGKRKYEKINSKGSPFLNYQEHAIKVDVEPSVSFNVQKSQALQQLTALMGASQEFSAFMNSPEGLAILVKNLTMYGADELQEAVPKWVARQEEQQQKSQQMQQEMMMQNPAMIKANAEMIKVQSQAEQSKIDTQIRIAELAIDKEKADSESILAQHKATQEEVNASVQREKAQAEIISHSLDAAGKMASIEHTQKMNEHESVRKSVELHHKIKNKSDRK